MASFAQAAGIIRREATGNPKLQAVISADKGVEYGKVVEIIDLVKQNGVGAFALDIERGTPPVAPTQTP
jgi:biopolymer transport protein ExbD